MCPESGVPLVIVQLYKKGALLPGHIKVSDMYGGIHFFNIGMNVNKLFEKRKETELLSFFSCNYFDSSSTGSNPVLITTNKMR